MHSEIGDDADDANRLSMVDEVIEGGAERVAARPEIRASRSVITATGEPSDLGGGEATTAYDAQAHVAK